MRRGWYSNGERQSVNPQFLSPWLAYELLLTADQSFQLQEGIGKPGCEKVQAKAVCVGLGQAYASSIADIVSSMGYQHDQDFAIAPELARVAERSGRSAKDLNLPWEALTLSVEARDKSEQGLRVEGANRTTPVSAEPIEVELATIEMPDVNRRSRRPDPCGGSRKARGRLLWQGKSGITDTACDPGGFVARPTGERRSAH